MDSTHVAAIVNSLKHTQIVYYFDVLAISLLVYDYILTLHAEVTLIWAADWNLTKAFFFLTRYPVFVDTVMALYHDLGKGLSIRMCDMLYRIIGWMFLCGISIAEASPIFNYRYSPHLIRITVILALTLVKGIPQYRQSNSPLIISLYRDGIMYYIYLFVLSVINVTVLLTAPREYANLLSLLQRVLHSVLSSRILLHLRQAANQSIVYVSGMPDSLPTVGQVSNIAFGAGRSGTRTMFSVDDGIWVSGENAIETHHGDGIDMP
ncbi:hypothetical protein EW146_g2864 [Bondarzewia mesenterica]|uniref:DUF6533 domain-containing protein n=1 Tax=Bondarzewia mesenterica TaxID=1095465 RepID=A0A4S4LZV9_9AGAM|nr:hypothetical protein EW146_g2864 [Bondarzewia mesenterica]